MAGAEGGKYTLLSKPPDVCRAMIAPVTVPLNMFQTTKPANR